MALKDMLKAEPKSDAAKIRNRLVDINAAMALGHTRQEIYEELKKEAGLEMTFEAFVVALKRARAKAAKERQQPEAEARVVSASHATVAVEQPQEATAANPPPENSDYRDEAALSKKYAEFTQPKGKRRT